MTKNLLYTKMKKMIALIDSLKDIGLNTYISLPRIAVLGLQSAGKSSLLEAIVGYDFLPRGEGTVTRRPLELRLVHVSGVPKPYAIFEENKTEKIDNFEIVKQKIISLTDRDAGHRKGIIFEPIVLTIYGETCPDLSLVDLPGITKIPAKNSDHPENIEELTIELARKYIDDPRTIILCVVQGNIDISTSDAIKIAKKVDKDGKRTLGVITKIDLLDKGTNIDNILNNEEIPLYYGYVAVKGRSQSDIVNNKSAMEGLEDEKLYFQQNFSHIRNFEEVCGTHSLVNKLTQILGKQIKTFLPKIIEECRARLNDMEDKYLKLGYPLPESDADKQQIVWKLIQELCEGYSNKVKGKYSYNNPENDDKITGNIIRKMFKNILVEEINSDKLTESLTDKDLKIMMMNFSGNNFSGFPSFDTFIATIKPFIFRFQPIIMQLIEDVNSNLENCILDLSNSIFVRFPQIQPIVNESAIKNLVEFKDKAKFLSEAMLKSELGFVYTGDKEYLIKYNEIFFQDDNSINKMRERITSYLKIVIKQLRDTIPKIIGQFLINNSIRSLQNKIQTDLSINQTLFEMFREPEEIILERKTLQKGISTLKSSIKKINNENLLDDDDDY